MCNCVLKNRRVAPRVPSASRDSHGADASRLRALAADCSELTMRLSPYPGAAVVCRISDVAPRAPGEIIAKY
jgi:hypothetical protein